MGKKLARIKSKQEIFWAFVDGNSARILENRVENLGELLQQEMRVSAEVHNLVDVEFLSPVTAPCQIICQGKNYLDHLKETGTRPEDKEFNLLFTKAPSALASSNGTLVKPAQVQLLDYELELGLVIGKRLTSSQQFGAQTLHKYVAGIVMANDVSARDVQVPERQWFKGKSFRGFCPVGPWIYVLEADEFASLGDLNLELKVNGKVRQKASTKQLMYKPAETLQEISGIFDLFPGDLVLTGTPGGVAMRVPKKNKWQELLGALKSDKEKMREFVVEQKAGGRYLVAGDKIESTIKSSDGRVDLGMQKLVVG